MDEIRNGTKMAAARIPSLFPYSDRSGHVPVLDPSIATFSKDIFGVGSSSLSAFLHSPLLSILTKGLVFKKAFPVHRISQINICPHLTEFISLRGERVGGSNAELVQTSVAPRQIIERDLKRASFAKCVLHSLMSHE